MVRPRATVRRQVGSSAPGDRSGSLGPPEDGSVRDAFARSDVATPGIAQTAYDANIPAERTPASSIPAARQPPRVAAENAARTLMRCLGVRWYTAARTACQPPNGVTGESEPNARLTPASAWAAKGFNVRARARPSRAAYMPCSPPQSSSKRGCTLAV